MKKTQLFIATLLLLSLHACQFSQSVKKDLMTGAYSRGDGLSSDDVKIEINGRIENRNTFIFGEQANFIFNNVDGFKRVDGLIYPGLSMYIIKNETDTLNSIPNLLENYKNGTDLPNLLLQAKFLVALPYGENGNYKASIKIWDRKSDATFAYELPFSVEKNDLLDIVSTDLNYANIYLWDDTEKFVMAKPDINMNHSFILILEEITGLEIINNKVYPKLSLNISDSKGVSILSSENILENFEQDGIDAAAFKKNQLPVSITFSPGAINNPCRLHAILSDQKSDKSIDIRADLEVR